MPKKDFLDEIIEEQTARNPEFPEMVEAALRRRRLLRQLGEVREGQEQSQTAVAAEMKSSQSSVARLEGSADDARLSTIDRFAEALGYRVQWHLLPLQEAAAEPPVVVHDHA
jgi:transcriptional regulator with XRE-family HTH domain